jgi:hypothetical protein
MSEVSANAEASANDDTAADSQQAVTADPVLLAARDQARAALEEITDAETIGSDLDHEVQGEHVLTLFFESKLAGYPGWMWAATVARVDEQSEVNVLEVEMLPGSEAVVAPDWVPWSERLAHYRETQSKLASDENELAESAAAELDDDDDDVDAETDLLDNDFSDFDDEIDGVDVEDFIDSEGDEGDDDEEEEFVDPEAEESGIDEN